MTNAGCARRTAACREPVRHPGAQFRHRSRRADAVLYLQLSTRPLRERPLTAVILVIAGAAETVPAASRIPLSLRDTGLLLLSLVIGIALAAVRALTMRIWADGDRVLRRGTILTALLWPASLVQHVVVTASVAGGLASSTLLIYFGLVLAAQHPIRMIRARSRGLPARPA